MQKLVDEDFPPDRVALLGKAGGSGDDPLGIFYLITGERVRDHAEHLVAFSCKKRGFCPSCGARRMAQSAALLVDEVFPEQPVRQWVLSVPYPLRFLFTSRPAIMGGVLGIVYCCIVTHLIKQARFTRWITSPGWRPWC